MYVVGSAFCGDGDALGCLEEIFTVAIGGQVIMCVFYMGILVSGWIILGVVGRQILGSVVGHVFKPWPSIAGESVYH